MNTRTTPIQGTTPDLFGKPPASRRKPDWRHRASPQYQMALSKKIRKADTEWRKKRGPNPAFPWSSWGDRPRSGALWTPLEISSLRISITSMQAMSEVLNLQHLCELAWQHGRSAEGVRKKLLELLGYKEYYEIFEADL